MSVNATRGTTSPKNNKTFFTSRVDVFPLAAIRGKGGRGRDFRPRIL